MLMAIGNPWICLAHEAGEDVGAADGQMEYWVDGGRERRLAGWLGWLVVMMRRKKGRQETRQPDHYYV